MGKASSAKKVARAARAGGRRSAGARQRNLLFPSAVGLIMVFGIGLVGFAANERKNDTQVPPVANQDHWHAAFGIYVCGEFLPVLPEFESPDGIHTHGDGVIHIHPFTQNAAGDNATLGEFLDAAGVELTDSSLTVDGKTYTEGDSTCGEGDQKKDGQVVVAHWKDVQSTDANPARIDQDLKGIQFNEDGEGYVLAFVPEGEDIPKPESASSLAELGSADSGPQTSTTTGDGSSTTAGDSTTTTTPGDSSTTTGG